MCRPDGGPGPPRASVFEGLIVVPSENRLARKESRRLGHAFSTLNGDATLKRGSLRRRESASRIRAI